MMGRDYDGCALFVFHVNKPLNEFDVCLFRPNGGHSVNATQACVACEMGNMLKHGAEGLT
jgi:hypothetical protein